VVFVAIVLEQLQLLLEIALGGDELTELARRFVGARAGEVEQGLQVEGGGHRRRSRGVANGILAARSRPEVGSFQPTDRRS